MLSITLLFKLNKGWNSEKKKMYLCLLGNIEMKQYSFHSKKTKKTTLSCKSLMHQGGTWYCAFRVALFKSHSVYLPNSWLYSFPPQTRVLEYNHRQSLCNRPMSVRRIEISRLCVFHHPWYEFKISPARSWLFLVGRQKDHRKHEGHEEEKQILSQLGRADMLSVGVLYTCLSCLIHNPSKMINQHFFLLMAEKK